MKRDNGKSKKAIVNDDIQSDPIRLILEDGEQRGIVALADAKELAAESKLDLVMISPDADPVVCKLMDYGKHVFELKKQKAANRKRQKIVHVKEIKFRPGTEEGDYQVKLRNLIRFLNDGDRAKVSLRFRGRELAHQHIGMELIHRIKKDLEEYGTVDQEAKMEGRQLIMVLAPIKKKK